MGEERREEMEAESERMREEKIDEMREERGMEKSRDEIH